MLLIHLFSFEFTPSTYFLLALVALLSGMSKTGIVGAGMLSVPLLAIVFGGQQSSGVMLPILLIADAFGVWYYHRHASLFHLKKVIPWALLGILLGTFVGKMLNDHVFKSIMAFTIFGSIILMLWLKSEKHQNHVPHSKVFAGSMGILGGFTSMVGNLAGSVMAVYLLAVRLPKNIYIGTTAWFFLIINWAKVPFHVMSWHTINFQTALLAISTSPYIAIGAFLGIYLVKKFSEQHYRNFIVLMTIVAAVIMLL